VVQTLENKLKSQLHARINLSCFEVFRQLGEEIVSALVGLLLGKSGEHGID